MSVVVAIKDKNKVWMGADLQCTSGQQKIILKNPNNFKIWKIQNCPKGLMGGVGNIRDLNVLSVYEDLIEELIQLKNEFNFKYVIQKIVPKITSIFETAKHIKQDSLYHDSEFLISYKDKLFLIGSDKSVIEIDDYFAIGSGKDFALGSLQDTYTNPKISIKDKIIKAILAANSNVYVGGGIVIGSTEDDIELVKSE